MNDKPHKSLLIAEADWRLLERICIQADVPPEMVAEMLKEENKVYGMGRRHGIHEKLDELITMAVRRAASAMTETGGER